MFNDQFTRFKALDRCFRNPLGGYTIDMLIKECEKAVSAFHHEDRVVARRTVEKDLEDLRLRYGVEFRKGYKDGKKMLYQYEDTSFSVMKLILADGNLEKQILQNVLDMLQCYDDVPQFSWLFTFLQGRINGINCNVDAVSFQNNPDLWGVVYFQSLLDCILKKQVVKFMYHPYDKNPRPLIVSPYQLKQFNDRWFLICKSSEFDTIYNLALDRMEGEISRVDVSYEECPEDLECYYDKVIGVTVDREKLPQKVLLRVTKRRYGFVQTKPFHSTQTEIHALEDENTKVIQFKVQINKELEAKILSFGNDIEVLEPQDLRDKVAERIRDLAKKYNI